MANTFRMVRGDGQFVNLPGYASDAIKVGDLLYWDATNDAVRPASTVSGTDYATKKSNLAADFVGVAMEAKAAGESRDVLAATAGDFQFAAPTGADTDAEPLDYVAGGDGTAMADQTVVKTATAGEAIGRVLAVKATTDATVLVRILSKFNLG